MCVCVCSLLCVCLCMGVHEGVGGVNVIPRALAIREGNTERPKCNIVNKYITTQTQKKKIDCLGKTYF